MNAQTNLQTGSTYLGNNQIILQKAKESSDYKSDKWVTFCQARSMNIKLVNAKGKGIHLKTFISDTEKNSKGKTKDVIRPITFCVFNTDLIEIKS